MNYFSVDGLSAGYGRKTVIKDISFSIDKGSLTGLLGANGCGKTTLIKAICGILPHKGRCALSDITFEELSAKKISEIISYIPQKSGIYISLSATEVVLMGFNSKLKLLEQPTEAMKNAAYEALKTVGLSGKEETDFLNLSEGQKQLCILARALVRDSRLMLFDEPESALDFRFRNQMLTIIKDRIAKQGGCAIVSLHDPMLALNFCDKLILLSDSSISSIIEPAKDSLSHMEEALSAIYGNISIQECRNKSGNTQLIMLKENEI